MSNSPTAMFDGVKTVPDNSDSDDETMSASSAESEGVRSVNGALLRTGSHASTGSRTSSMRAKPIKKIPANTEAASQEDEMEAIAELEKAATSGIANLHDLRLGLNIRTIIKLLKSPTLENLTQLSLQENGFETLPHNIFESVPNLVKLALSDNKLTFIPYSVMTLKKLEVLLLDHNNISSVPATFDIAEPLEMPALQVIGLDWNKLTEYPAHLHEIAPNLRKVYICENLDIHNLPPLDTFPPSPPIEMRLDNRPSLLEQFARGGYDSRLIVDWNKIFPDKVMDYVYLGSLRTAQCETIYRELDIKYVLTAGRNLEAVIAEDMQQLALPLDDLPGENISLFFKEAFNFIDQAIADKKGVLLHCFAGLSRSVTVMVAYLMKTRYPISARAALELVKQARPNSNPNDGFMKSLEKYEGQLRVENGEAPPA